MSISECRASLGKIRDKIHAATLEKGAVAAWLLPLFPSAVSIRSDRRISDKKTRLAVARDGSTAPGQS
jgi:hypothetical protein